MWPRVDGSRAAPRGAVLKSGTRAAADSLSKPCEWGLLLLRETGRPTSRSVSASSLGLRHTSPLRHNWPHPFDSARLRGFPWWRCSTRPGVPLFGSRFKRVQAAYSSLPASGAAHGHQDVETEGLKSFCPFCEFIPYTQRAPYSSCRGDPIDPPF